MFEVFLMNVCVLKRCGHPCNVYVPESDKQDDETHITITPLHAMTRHMITITRTLTILHRRQTYGLAK